MAGDRDSRVLGRPTARNVRCRQPSTARGRPSTAGAMTRLPSGESSGGRRSQPRTPPREQAASDRDTGQRGLPRRARRQVTPSLILSFLCPCCLTCSSPGRRSRNSYPARRRAAAQWSPWSRQPSLLRRSGSESSSLPSWMSPILRLMTYPRTTTTHRPSSRRCPRRRRYTRPRSARRSLRRWRGSPPATTWACRTADKILRSPERAHDTLGMGSVYEAWVTALRKSREDRVCPTARVS